MKLLQNTLLQLRTSSRRAAARLGRRRPSQVRPARLVIRLDDADLSGTLSGERAPLARWQAWLVEAIQWLGTTPVTLRAGSLGGDGLTVDLVRFAHRLDCPTLLACDGAGLDDDAALRLVDAGLSAVRLEVSDDGALAEAAAQALVAARQQRRVTLDIEVVLIWQGAADTVAPSVLHWVRRVGCDGFRISPPWRAENMPADPALLERLLAEAGPLNRTHRGAVPELHAMVAQQDGEPGMAKPRTGRRCPVGGQRVVLAADGGMWSCPFKVAVPRGGTVAERWEEAGAHLGEIAGCGRACAHVELAPEPVVR